MTNAQFRAQLTEFRAQQAEYRRLLTEIRPYIQPKEDDQKCCLCNTGCHYDLWCYFDDEDYEDLACYECMIKKEPGYDVLRQNDIDTLKNKLAEYKNK